MYNHGMTTIEVSGHADGRPVSAVWRDGVLEGDPGLVAVIEGMVAGEARVSIPGIVASVATLDPAEELLVPGNADVRMRRETLPAACGRSGGSVAGPIRPGSGLLR